MKIHIISGLVLSIGSSATAEASLKAKKQPSLVTYPLIPHHAQLQRQRRLDRPAQNWTEPATPQNSPFDIQPNALYQGYGTHYVDLWVGTPPQRQTVIVDTGSSVTAFPCMDCAKCGEGYHIDGNFQEEHSTTYQDVECHACTLGHCTSSPMCELSVSYQEGSSWRAYEGTDLVYAGGPHDIPEAADESGAFRFHFGCQTHLTGLFKTQLADGIMGMEMASSSFWKQAFQEHAISSQAFGLCFSRQPVASKEGTGAGIMTLGGTDPRLHSTTMVYANQPNSDGWFTVRIKKLYLRVGGGESVQVADSTEDDAATVQTIDISETSLNNGEVIIDSGTTDTYLSRALEAPFKATYKAIMNGQDWIDENSVHLTDEELLAMPTILIQLAGKDGANLDPMAQGLAGPVDATHPNDILVAMPPTHYMEYSAKTQKYTPRFYFTESHGGVLGANFMMGHEILFDVENHQVGFAESHCDYEVVAGEETSG